MADTIELSKLNCEIKERKAKAKELKRKLREQRKAKAKEERDKRKAEKRAEKERRQQERKDAQARKRFDKKHPEHAGDDSFKVVDAGLSQDVGFFKKCSHGIMAFGSATKDMFGRAHIRMLQPFAEKHAALQLEATQPDLYKHIVIRTTTTHLIDLSKKLGPKHKKSPKVLAQLKKTLVALEESMPLDISPDEEAITRTVRYDLIDEIDRMTRDLTPELLKAAQEILDQALRTDAEPPNEEEETHDRDSKDLDAEFERAFDKHDPDVTETADRPDGGADEAPADDPTSPAGEDGEDREASEMAG